MEYIISQAYDELKRIRQIKKCTHCECLIDVLEAMKADLHIHRDPKIKDVLKEFDAWIIDGNAERHSCLGCEECLPIEPYNRFNSPAKAEAEAATGMKACASCTSGGDT